MVGPQAYTNRHWPRWWRVGEETEKIEPGQASAQAKYAASSSSQAHQRVSTLHCSRSPCLPSRGTRLETSQQRPAAIPKSRSASPFEASAVPFGAPSTGLSTETFAPPRPQTEHASGMGESSFHSPSGPAHCHTTWGDIAAGPRDPPASRLHPARTPHRGRLDRTL